MNNNQLQVQLNKLKKQYIENKPMRPPSMTQVVKMNIDNDIQFAGTPETFRTIEMPATPKKRKIGDTVLPHNKIKIIDYKRASQISCKLCKHEYCLDNNCKYTHPPLSDEELIDGSIIRTADNICACPERKYPGTCNNYKYSKKISNLIDQLSNIIIKKDRALYCTPCKYNRKCKLFKQHKCDFHHDGQVCSCYEGSVRVGMCIKAKIKAIKNMIEKSSDMVL